ncbi:MAG: DUF1611 domain-containing protein [Gemmatimonadaceae bacterium]|nr:DUF1611 domain-containing protein [Gemmatimonadaceae bacterium]
MPNAMPPEISRTLRIPYALRRVPEASMKTLLPVPEEPRVGDLAVARVEKIGKNTNLELAGGRRASLHEGDVIAVVFGNRYATLQFEGYARVTGDRCDLLSMGGLCGLVASRHDGVAEPSKLRLLGALGDAAGNQLRLRDFAISAGPRDAAPPLPRIAVVVGTSMDAGKTHTARSVIAGMRRAGIAVGALKLTGSAAGRDTYTMLDAGAHVALDFIDGGWPSTYLCALEDLLGAFQRLVAYAAAQGTEWLIVEIADGIVQGETAALLASARFRSMVDAWLVAAGDALGAAGAMALLRSHRIAPLAVSGVVSRSDLARREVLAATGVQCISASALEDGALNAQLTGARHSGSFRVFAG